MIIAVNTVFFPGMDAKVENEWIVQYFSRLALQQPEHLFIFISNNPSYLFPVEAKNISLVVTGKLFKSLIGLNIWHNYRLPVVLKKIKADVLINPGGIAVVRTKVPQLLLLNHSRFLEQPLKTLTKAGRFSRKQMPGFLNKANRTLLSSAYAFETISKAFPVMAKKLYVLEPGIDDAFHPVDWEEKEKWKEQLTGGKEYFLFTGNIDGSPDPINLLKAFSLFKKRQKSNMQLLMISPAEPPVAFKEIFKTYKYREDVLLMIEPGKSTFQNILAAAYVVICPPAHSDFNTLPLQAMRCEVPVIVFNDDTVTHLLGAAAIYVNPNDPQQTANALMLLFKDENERNALISEGKEVVKPFNWDKSTVVLWQHILETANQ